MRGCLCPTEVPVIHTRAPMDAHSLAHRAFLAGLVPYIPSNFFGEIMRFLQIPRTWIAALVALTVVWFGLTVFLYTGWGTIGMVAGFALGLFALLFVALEVQARVMQVHREQTHHDRQLQSVLNLHAVLKPDAPLPTMRLAALAPDTGVEYMNLILRHKPATIVELGSGVSTLIAALLLKRQGSGRVIALDHDKEWLKLTRRMLADHGVEEWADLRYAPLVPVQGSGWPWYNPEALADVQDIDLLLVDGPPDYKDEGTRRPGLFLLEEKLTDQAHVVVDDCIRPNWYKWTVQWAGEKGFTVEEPFHNEKRSLLLHRKG